VRLALPVCALTLVYALVLASLDPLDLLMGAVVSTIVTLGLRAAPDIDAHDERLAGLPRRMLAFPWFVLGLLGEVLAGTWDTMLRALGVRSIARPGIVLVPIGERTRLGVAVSGLATTLAPGSVLVDVDWERGAMLVHVIDAGDPEAVRAQHRAFYERFQRGSFP